MDGPVTLMMQKTLLVKKDQAGNQDAIKKRMLKVVRASARRRWGSVRGGVGVGCGFGFGIWGVGGLEWGGRRECEGRERWRVGLRRWRVGRRGRRKTGMRCVEFNSY